MELFENLSIASNVAGQPPPLAGEPPNSFIAFRSCDFNVTNGSVWGSESAGAILVLDSCFDASGAAVGTASAAFAFITADTYGIELYNGTQVAQNCIFTPAVGWHPERQGQPRLHHEWLPGEHGRRLDAQLQLWGAERTGPRRHRFGRWERIRDYDCGAPFTWPTPAAGGVQLQTALLLINTGGAGSAAVTVGQIAAGGTIFAQGQVIQVVVTVGAGGEIITLLQPSGAAISGAPNLLGLAGAAVGEARGCTLRCDRADDPANTWSVIDTFVVPS